MDPSRYSPRSLHVHFLHEIQTISINFFYQYSFFFLLLVIIFLKLFFCREQVIVPKEKQFILLEGEDWSSTVIQWNGHIMPSDVKPTDDETSTAAFVVTADNFIAQKITFQVLVTIFLWYLYL